MPVTTRRDFLLQLGGAMTAAASTPQMLATPAGESAPRSIAAAVSVYTHNSHADVIVSRLLEGYNLDGKSARPNLKLVSLYLDQVPQIDIGQKLAATHGVRLCKTIDEALNLGRRDLAVDGVLLIGE